MVTPDDVRRLALALPEAYEQPSHDGRPSWRTKPRMFACLRTDPDALVVWVESLDAKEAMLASEPRLFFTTPHYDGYPIVLVRMHVVSAARAEALIGESWRVRAPTRATKTKPAAAKATKAKPGRQHGNK